MKNPVGRADHKRREEQPVTTDILCEHGTVLAAWCGQCASEWVLPAETEPAETDAGQSAA